MKKIRQYVPGLACFVGCLVASSPTWATTPTEEMSDTVERLCPALKSFAATNPGGLTAAENDVLARCGELKRAPGQSFGQLSSDQVRGLENMTSEETSVMGTSTVEISSVQFQAIVGRLASLRATTGGNVASVGKPQPEKNGVSLASSGSSPQTDRQQVHINALQVNDYSLDDRLRAYGGSYNQATDYGNLGVFVNSSYSTGDKDATAREAGFDFDSFSIVTGADYRLRDNFILGGALGYAVTNSDVVNNGGSIDLDGIGLSLYGTYYVNQFYLDFLAGIDIRQFDTTRNLNYSVAANTGGTTVVNQSFDGSTDATDINLSVGAGYEQRFGKLGLTPYFLANYLHSEIDGYTESRNGTGNTPGFGLPLTVDDQTIDSLTSSLGVQVTQTINASFGVLTPYVKGDWVHEYENDARTIRASFADVRSSYDSLNYILIPTDDPDRDYMNLGAGLLTVLPGGMQIFVDYTTVIGYQDLSLHRVAAGIRMEF